MSQELDRASRPLPSATTMINLAPATQLDVSSMSAEAVAVLQGHMAKGVIDSHAKARELQLENASLATVLNTLNTEAGRATQANVAVTMTHTQTSSMGRTEVVIGNTDRAASGKMSSSAMGVPDRTLWIVGIAAAAVIVLAIVLSHH